MRYAKRELPVNYILIIGALLVICSFQYVRGDAIFRELKRCEIASAPMQRLLLPMDPPRPARRRKRDILADHIDINILTREELILKAPIGPKL